MQISFVYNENKISGIVTAEPHKCVRHCDTGNKWHANCLCFSRTGKHDNDSAVSRDPEKL